MMKKILLIDDENIYRSIMRKNLSRYYEVLEAPDGLQGISILETHAIDLIILDMQMPLINGLEFLDLYQRTGTRHVPVLVMSGLNEPDIIVQSYQRGAYDYILKNENFEILLKRIENGLKIGEQLRYNEEIKGELMMAKKLQELMLPPRVMSSNSLTVRTWNRPLSGIGGDLFDCIYFRDRRVMFYIADVVGHSISAALYTMMVKMLFGNTLKTTQDPGSILTIMNHEISTIMKNGAFVTMFCGMIHLEEKRLEYSNAGNVYPLLRGRQGVEELRESEIFLGPFSDRVYKTVVRDFHPGDILMVFTDGLVELINDKDDILGNEYLKRILMDSYGNTNDMYRSIVDYLEKGDEYTIRDDCSFLLMEAHKE